MVLLCLDVADPATSLASNSVLQDFFFFWEQQLGKMNISEFVLLPQ